MWQERMCALQASVHSKAYSLTGQLMKCSQPLSGLCQAGRAQGACPRALREGTVKPLFEQLGQRVGFSADNSPERKEK